MTACRPGIPVFLLLLASCSQLSSSDSHQKVRDLDAELSRRLGASKQADILSLMGEPSARDLVGDLEVWVYQYGSDNRDISPEYKVVAPKHDELILSFDRGGTLQKYTVILEGRTTQRGRSR